MFCRSDRVLGLLSRGQAHPLTAPAHQRPPPPNDQPLPRHYRRWRKVRGPTGEFARARHPAISRSCPPHALATPARCAHKAAPLCPNPPSQPAARPVAQRCFLTCAATSLLSGKRKSERWGCVVCVGRPPHTVMVDSLLYLPVGIWFSKCSPPTILVGSERRHLAGVFVVLGASIFLKAVLQVLYRWRVLCR